MKKSAGVAKPGRPYPWAQDYDHTYEITRLHYRFRCNADPQGVVVYDVVFTPEDGSAPVHEARQVPTGGATQVTDQDGQPFVLDPVHPTNAAVRDASQPNGKKNGTYQVVPIQLQPDDWTDPDSDGGTSGQAGTRAAGGQPRDVDPDSGWQLGLIGAMVPSILSNTSKHFVTPKQHAGEPALAPGSVRLRAPLPKVVADDFDRLFEWVKPKDPDTGAEVGTANGRFFDVPRNKPGKYAVTIRTKVQPPRLPADALAVDTLNVWVVWATGKFVHTPDVNGHLVPTTIKGFDGENRDGLAFLSSSTYGDPNTGYIMKFTIEPPGVTDEGQDVPNLTGKSNPAYPPSLAGRWPVVLPKLPEYDTSLGAANKRDVSQSVQDHILNPKMFSKDYMSEFETYDLYNHQAKADDLVVDFPTSDVEGNDDVAGATQENNPYEKVTTAQLPCLNHEMGVLIGADAPVSLTPGDPSSTYGDPFNHWEGWTYEEANDFATFVRLQINNKWYRVSNHLNWHHDPSLILRTGLCERKNTAYERKESNRASLRP